MSELASKAFDDDRVVIVLGNKEIRISEGFHISQSVLIQPSTFEIKLGRGSIEKDPKRGPTVRELIQAYPPNTEAAVYVNDHLRMTGATDGFRAFAAGGQGGELTIFGRDALAPLHDAHIAEDFSFDNATYLSLVSTALAKVQLGDRALSVNNDLANRKLQAGVPVKDLLPPVRTLARQRVAAETSGAKRGVLQAKLGERWFDFIRKQIDRAGLFLWSAADGTFMLSQPSVNQAAIYRIVRRRGQTRDQTNVINAEILTDTRPRYASCSVYGRLGSGAHGVHKCLGVAVDTEMTDRYGYKQRGLYIRDVHCRSTQQAEFLAMRKLAEGRRQGSQLMYVMAGLSTPALGSLGRAVWTPDTIVHVVDEEYGIDDEYWIDTVTMSRHPETTTTMRIVRKNDLIFGTADFENAKVETGAAARRTIDQLLEE